MIEDSSFEAREFFSLKLNGILPLLLRDNPKEEEDESRIFSRVLCKRSLKRDRSIFRLSKALVAHESEASRRRIFKDRRWPHHVKWKFPRLCFDSTLGSTRPRWREQKEMHGLFRHPRYPEIYVPQWRHDLGRRPNTFRNLRSATCVSCLYTFIENWW